jgi:hypothetical protein
MKGIGPAEQPAKAVRKCSEQPGADRSGQAD